MLAFRRVNQLGRRQSESLSENSLCAVWQQQHDWRWQCCVEWTVHFRRRLVERLWSFILHRWSHGQRKQLSDNNSASGDNQCCCLGVGRHFAEQHMDTLKQHVCRKHQQCSDIRFRSSDRSRLRDSQRIRNLCCKLHQRGASNSIRRCCQPDIWKFGAGRQRQSFNRNDCQLGKRVFEPRVQQRHVFDW